MAKSKMIAKGCPKCKQQVPVACKACQCGHSFFNARRTSRASSTTSVDIRRRTQRVRREKPNYYDALEFEKRIRKTKSRNSECDEDDGKKDNIKKKKKVKKEEEEEEDLNIINNLSPEKQLQCTLILEELNRKLQMVTWKPSF